MSNDGKTQEITIEDNGIGFPQNKADDIFAPFQRLHGQGKYEGSGIGLATCKRIVDFHSWRIRAESEEGKGSKFIISLPRAVEPITGEPIKVSATSKTLA